tara:strand:- start:581 stop:1087 length:507 start_codon:yes stop_codon:yes gene_type:complete
MKNVLILIFILKSWPVVAENEVNKVTDDSLLRYVSIKSSEANLRKGPSKDYPILIKYTKKNVPLLVIDEINLYGDLWRKVIDYNNNEGWIWRNLLSNKRYGIIKKNTDTLYANIFLKPNKKIVGEIGYGNIVKINECKNNWCNIKISNYKGWIKKDNLWGVFDNEVFD